MAQKSRTSNDVPYTVRNRRCKAEPDISSDESISEVKISSEIRPRRTNRRTLFFCAVLACIILLLGGSILLSNLMSVRSVSLIGLNEAWGYDDAEVLSACGISVGDRLRAVEQKSVSEKLSEAFPYLRGATLQKSLFGEVIITVINEDPSYLYTFEGKVYVLSSGLKVLALATRAEDLIELNLSNVESCTEGELLRFLNEYDFDFVCQTAKKITALLDDFEINRIGLENKFDIYVVCESKYKLLFGNRDSLEKKAVLAKGTLKDPMFLREGMATVDVASGNKASVKFENFGN